MKPATALSVVFLTLVAIAHLIRLVLRVEVVAAGYTIPLWVSVAAVIVPAALAAGLWRESRRS